MRIRASLVFVTTLLLALSLAAPALARPAAFASGHATLHPANGSGVMGNVTYTQTSTGVHGTGTATGLQPSFARYVTLVYDRGSVPGGPDNCEPSPGNAMPGMFVGIWSVDSQGNGTLIQAVADSEIAPLGEFDTTSIRDTTINSGFGPGAVVACGEVALRPAN